MCFSLVRKRVRNTLGLRLREITDHVIYESLPVSYTPANSNRLSFPLDLPHSNTTEGVNPEKTCFGRRAKIFREPGDSTKLQETRNYIATIAYIENNFDFRRFHCLVFFLRNIWLKQLEIAHTSTKIDSE